MKLLLLGPQGSGKGTLGKLLSEKLELTLVGVGSILRALPENHTYYDIVNNAMNKGILVPWEVAAEILRDRLSLTDCKKGFILDGWGRNYESLEMYDPGFDGVIYINISHETSIKRITGRRICETDSTVCNIYTLPDSSSNNCSKCQGELTQRDDDTEEAVIKRLEIFNSDTMKVISYYREKGLLQEIDGEKMPNVVLASALETLKG